MEKDNRKLQMHHLHRTIDTFHKVATEQELKGLEKYGEPLDPMNVRDEKTGETYDWLAMAGEESVDGFKYLEAEKQKRKVIVGKIRDLLQHEDINVGQINYWLDVLEGK